MARKTPTRTCIACGKTGDKRSFWRVVRTPEGAIACDASGKMPGRGAYLCKDAKCLEKAAEKRLLDARLRCKVSAQDYDKLKDQFRDLLRASAQAQ